MPSPDKVPLAQRVGPLRAGGIKSTCRRWREDKGLGYREIAKRIAETQGVALTPASIRRWSEREGWARPPAHLAKPRTRDRTPTKKQAERDAAQCRWRCPVCLKPLDAPGAAHVCAVLAGQRYTVFGGNYL